MADIRIKDLSATALAPNRDDFIEIDGAGAGTRKLSAQHMDDLRNALAPRQALVFDGTAGGSVANVPVFRTGDFTVAAWIRLSSLTQNNVIVDGAFAFFIGTDGSIRVLERTGDTFTYTGYAGQVVVGKTYFIAYVRGKIYLNGNDLSGSFTDTTDLTNPTIRIGWALSNDSALTGPMSGPFIYNRALSAAEVKQLYETGAPAASDFNNASNASLATALTPNGYTGSTSTASSWSGATAAATYANVIPTVSFVPVAGKRYRFAVGAVTGAVHFVGFGIGDHLITSNEILDYVSTGGTPFFYTGSAESFSVSGFSLTPLGLLVAPDTAQLGSGNTWRDVSGNGADITKTSATAWNLPWGGHQPATTFDGAITPSAGIIGTTTNNNAASGNVGEYISSAVASGSAVGLVSNTPKTVTSISLTPGDWDLGGVIGYTFGGGATANGFTQGISDTTNSFGAENTYTLFSMTWVNTGFDASLNVPAQRVSITSPTTYYLVARASFGVSTCAAYGKIFARRVR